MIWYGYGVPSNCLINCRVEFICRQGIPVGVLGILIYQCNNHRSCGWDEPICIFLLPWRWGLDNYLPPTSSLGSRHSLLVQELGSPQYQSLCNKHKKELCSNLFSLDHLLLPSHLLPTASNTPPWVGSLEMEPFHCFCKPWWAHHPHRSCSTTK